MEPQEWWEDVLPSATVGVVNVLVIRERNCRTILLCPCRMCGTLSGLLNTVYISVPALILCARENNSV